MTAISISQGIAWVLQEWYQPCQFNTPQQSWKTSRLGFAQVKTNRLQLFIR